jgi:hypothetical protein
MSVRSFHSVFMASVVAGAALGCYLVSLRVASERSALEEVETNIVLAQRDIRLLQTEIGTRGRLAQLERWNVRVLALSAPSAEQILGDKFQLAKLVRPQREFNVDAPVVLASAPAPQAQPGVADSGSDAAVPAAQLLHEASLTVRDRAVAKPVSVQAKPEAKKASAQPPVNVASIKAPAVSKPVVAKAVTALKKAGDKSPKALASAVTRPTRTAKVDPLAPLPAGHPTAKGTRTEK